MKKKIYKRIYLKKQIFFYRFSMIGLGFKIFVRKKYLWVFIGLTHYTKFKIPKDLYIKNAKRKILFYTYNKNILLTFMAKLKNFKHPSKYKGKGLIEFKQFKGFVKEKKGKRQYR